MAQAVCRHGTSRTKQLAPLFGQCVDGTEARKLGLTAILGVQIEILSIPWSALKLAAFAFCNEP